jgi:hypothetical protein
VVTIERHFSARNAPYAPSIAINLLKSQQNDAPSERATTSLSKSYEWLLRLLPLSGEVGNLAIHNNCTSNF